MDKKAGLFGQHLIIDGEVARLLVRKAGINKEESVLEIGAGNGTITRRLCDKAKVVTAFEIDGRFRRVLEMDKPENLEMLFGNALESLRRTEKRFDKIVSNPPFDYLPAIFSIAIGLGISGGSIIVPLTFAKKTIEEGVFFKAFYSEIETEEVPASAFSPHPDTRTVILSFRKTDAPSEKDKLARELFFQKDKALKNSLREALVRVKGISKREAKEKISSIGLESSLLEELTGRIPEQELARAIEKAHSV